MDEGRPGRRADAPPALIWAIAALGVLPFPASAVMYGYGPEDLQRHALTALFAWSAMVLAFIGGVRWGLESREPRPRRSRLAFAALCGTAACGVLLGRGQAPDAWLLGLFIAVFLIQWLSGRQDEDGPSRYPVLSNVMAGAACASLALALEKAISG